MPRGKKICPECKKENGVRTFTCECGFDFSSIPKKIIEKKKIKKEKIPLDKIIGPLETFVAAGEEIEKISPRKHAKRILALGKDRAFLLSQQSKGRWSHVDWDYVKEQLGILNSIG